MCLGNEPLNLSGIDLHKIDQFSEGRRLALGICQSKTLVVDGNRDGYSSLVGGTIHHMEIIVLSDGLGSHEQKQNP